MSYRNTIPTYNLYTNMATAATATMPLPTAYGYPAYYIPVLDAISAKVTATGVSTASPYGGVHRTYVSVNSTSTTAAVFSMISDIGFTPTAAASGIQLSNNVWEASRGIPLWSVTGADAPSNPAVAVTAWYIRSVFTGSTIGTAGGQGTVELFVSWHYEDPSARR